MRIEICICSEDNSEEFEHEGYYDSIDEAVDALRRLKKTLKPSDKELIEYKVAQCNKCVWQFNTCPGPIWRSNAITGEGYGFCPPGYTYKRDPPDGGYYG